MPDNKLNLYKDWFSEKENIVTPDPMEHFQKKKPWLSFLLCYYYRFVAKEI